MQLAMNSGAANPAQPELRLQKVAKENRRQLQGLFAATSARRVAHYRGWRLLWQPYERWICWRQQRSRSSWIPRPALENSEMRAKESMMRLHGEPPPELALWRWAQKAPPAARMLKRRRRGWEPWHDRSIPPAASVRRALRSMESQQ